MVSHIPTWWVEFCEKPQGEDRRPHGLKYSFRSVSDETRWNSLYKVVVLPGKVAFSSS